MCGLRIAPDRSTNIGSSLTTPAHGWPDPTEKDAYVVAVPWRARGTCDASTNASLTPMNEAGGANTRYDPEGALQIA